MSLPDPFIGLGEPRRLRGPSVEPLRGQGISPGNWDDLVTRVEGTQLVIGGPGTGKTELLACRAAHLINSETASSDAVLGLSFSRETASDLRGRITAAAQRSFGGLSVGTFYAFARTLVEENCQELFGTSQPPMLLTAPEQIHFVKEVLADEPPEDWPLFYRRMLHTHTLAEELTDFMLRCGEQRISPEQLADRARKRPAWAALPGFYRHYLRRLEEENKIDYTGLLLRANRALGIPEIVRNTAARFPYVLVDEFQEATVVQVEILKRLVAAGCHLTAVADPQQTSFSFLGAERASVSAFPQTFDAVAHSTTNTVILNTSFRVPGEVLSSAGALVGIDHHTLPAPAPHAGKVETYVFDQEMAENDWIASEIKRLHLTEQLPYSKIAVLTRTLRPLAALSRALDREDIPHARPNTQLIDHPAVRLVLDLAWVAAVDTHPHLSRSETEAVDRIMKGALLGPLFSLTQGRARELEVIRRGAGQRWAQVMAENLPDAKALSDLLNKPSWAKTPPATTGFWKFWSHIPQFHRLVESDQPASYRSTLFSFAQTLGRLAERSPRTCILDYRRLTLGGDLEASPLLKPYSPDESGVTISTIHQAKGQQFEVVFIAGATEGVFPDTRPFTSLLEGQFLSRPDVKYLQILESRLEEELNLAYVAMTRARLRVVWTATSPDLNEMRSTVSRFMLRLADFTGQKLRPPSPKPNSSPLGRLETEGYLRRTQQDIHQSRPRRLAASMVLANPPRTDLWDPRSFAGVRSPGSDLGLIDPGHVMSASQAEAYQICPRRYALERRLRIRPVDENLYARFGQLIHHVLQRSGERCLERGEAGLNLHLALQELDDQLATFDFGTPVLNQAWRERGIKLLDRLAQRWEQESGQAVSFEEAIDIELDGISWKGRIDRIDRMGDGTLRIVDYKTSKNPMTANDAKIALQLGFYLWAKSRLSPGANASAAEFWYPLCEKPSWKRSFDPVKVEEVIKLLGEIGQAIISEKADPQPWLPRPSQACGRCQVRSLCPAWPEGQGAFTS